MWAALPGAAEEDVIAQLVANAEPVMNMGEKSWIESLGIQPKFWSHGEWSL